MTRGSTKGSICGQMTPATRFAGSTQTARTRTTYPTLLRVAQAPLEIIPWKQDGMAVFKNAILMSPSAKPASTLARIRLQASAQCRRAR